jgi:hypothetical protein
VEAAEADSLGVDIINTSLGYFEFDNTTTIILIVIWMELQLLYPEELKSLLVEG